MSVDTYLRGKSTDRYARIVSEDLELLLSPMLVRWAGGIRLDATSFLGLKRFSVVVEHQHTTACAH